MKKVRFGIIGYGNRARCMLPLFLNIEGAEVTAVCDNRVERMESAARAVMDKTGHEPYKTTDYNTLLNKELVDAVYVATDCGLCPSPCSA